MIFFKTYFFHVSRFTHTGFLFPEAESQIGELVRYCNKLKYWSYCLYRTADSI